MIFNQTMANQSLERRLLESALRKGIKSNNSIWNINRKLTSLQTNYMVWRHWFDGITLI